MFMILAEALAFVMLTSVPEFAKSMQQTKKNIHQVSENASPHQQNIRMTHHDDQRQRDL